MTLWGLGKEEKSSKKTGRVVKARPAPARPVTSSPARNAGSPGRSSGSSWTWPTRTATISQGVTGRHIALDITGARGSPVISPVSGIVRDIKYQEQGYGLNVRVTTPEGYDVILGHLDATTAGLAKGAQITAGQVVGLLGSSGNSTGPHVHLEVRAPGYAADRFSAGFGSGVGAVDPTAFFGGKPAGSAIGKPGESFVYAPVTHPGIGVASGAPSDFAFSASSSSGKAPATIAAKAGGKPAAGSSASKGKGIVLASTPIGNVTVPAPGSKFIGYALVGVGIVVILIALAMLARSGIRRGKDAAIAVAKRGPGLVPVSPKAIIGKVSSAAGVGL